MTRKGKSVSSAPGAAGKPLRPPTVNDLWAAFFDTDEMAEYLAATNKIRAAVNRGDKEVSLPTEFLAKRLPDVIPFHDRDFVDAWNRVCDEVGLPEQKMPFPEEKADPMVLQNDLHVGRKINLKKSPAGDEEDGPF